MWNNILKNGLLPMLTNTNDGEDALTSSDIQAFSKNYTPGRAQIRDDRRMVGNENESRVVLGSYFCEDGIDLRYRFQKTTWTRKKSRCTMPLAERSFKSRRPS